MITKINSVTTQPKTGTGVKAGETEKVYSYEELYISEKPSQWTPVQTANGNVLDERYLTKADVSFSQTFTPQVDLVFNTE